MAGLTAPPQITQSPIASTMQLSFDGIHSTYEQFMILKRMTGLSMADINEFKMLIRQLRRLMTSGPFRKAGLEDAEHDDERPTPNAHRITTSSPTGATSIDPDDDPRYWGAHPIGLLSPRRGHQ